MSNTFKHTHLPLMHMHQCSLLEPLFMRLALYSNPYTAHTLGIDHQLLHRIFRMLGPPIPKAWPELEALPHWRDNTEGVRTWFPPQKSTLPQSVSDHT